MEYIKSKIRDVYDFPKPGIIFRDLTTMFKDPRAMHIVGWDLAQLYRDKGVTKVVGIESRGFIGGAILAYEIGAGFVPARKPGKLPADTVSASFEKEYGTDTIEIHRDAITPDDVVVLHDDLLATGGTMAACYELVKSMNPRKIYINFIVELSALNGRKNLPADADVRSLIVSVSKPAKLLHPKHSLLICNLKAILFKGEVTDEDSRVEVSSQENLSAPGSSNWPSCGSMSSLLKQYLFLSLPVLP